MGFEVNHDLKGISLDKERVIINTLNPHSYIVSKSDEYFREALKSSDILVPDGIGICLASKILTGKQMSRIAGADVHSSLLGQLQDRKGKCLYLGSSEATLSLIKKRINAEFPDIIVHTISPPFVDSIFDHDFTSIIDEVNKFEPDVLFVGMTAPKQEKWVHHFKDQISAKVISTIGAVFDFYAGTTKRAPLWMQKMGMEWIHRSIVSPSRLGVRNFTSNPKFLVDVFLFKLRGKK